MTTFCVIDIDSWNSGWKVLFSFGWLAASVLYAAIKLYATKKYLAEIFSALHRSPLAISSSLLSKNQNLIIKSFIMSSTRGYFSSRLVKEGHISAADLESFPPHLKVVLNIDFFAAIITLSWLFVLCFLILIRGKFEC